MKKMALKLLTKTWCVILLLMFFMLPLFFLILHLLNLNVSSLQQAFRLNEWGEMTVTKVLKTLGAITEGGKEKSMVLLSELHL